MKTYHELARHEGNRDLFEAVEMAIISSLWGSPLHIHAQGLRGTGKTTIMRAAKAVFPPIRRIKGCLYNCDPESPHCPHHRDLDEDEVAALGIEIVPMPFLEISHSAKVGTVAGSIDLAKITDPTRATAALLPGIIPQAHRGVVFIDEINRLADTSPEITDILLDVMGTKPGRVQIEETGLPTVEVPVQVSVWAASNPDEEPGPLEEIRKQLSDRFDLVIDMARPTNIQVLADILARSDFSRINGHGSGQEPSAADLSFREELLNIAGRYDSLVMPDYLRNFIARIYVKHNLESIRAIEALQQAAILNCALRKRDQVLISDVLKVIPLVLKHRVGLETVTEIMKAISSGSSRESSLENIQQFEIASHDSKPANSHGLFAETVKRLMTYSDRKKDGIQNDEEVDGSKWLQDKQSGQVIEKS